MLHEQLWSVAPPGELVSRPPTFTNMEAHLSPVSSVKALPDTSYDPSSGQPTRLAAFQGGFKLCCLLQLVFSMLLTRTLLF